MVLASAMSAFTTSKVLVDRYLKGREILFKDPEYRTDADLSFLRKWLPENIQLFRNLDSGKQSNSRSGTIILLPKICAGILRMILESVTVETYYPNEVVYEQDASVFK